jgi:hypothetical protein
MTLLSGTLLTITIVLISILGLLIVRNWMNKSDLKTQHDITDPYSQFVAMLFAVLLGFMIADAMQRFAEARNTVQLEASALGNVYRLAEGLPQDKCRKVRTLCRSYAVEVIQDEWEKMTQKSDSPRVWDIYRTLWTSVTTFEPTSNRESNAQQLLLTSMQSMGDNRRLRIEALHAGLPLELWVVLFFGGAATIVFTYFFSADNLKIQIVMVGLVSLVICLNLFLLATYDDPFSGDVRITPDAFVTQLNLYNKDNL